MVWIPSGSEQFAESPASMKRIAVSLIFLSLSLAACQSVGAAPGSSSPVSVASPTDVSPVYISALCTLMGQPVRSDVPAGRPVIVMWGWSASSMEQMQDYLGASVVKVAFDDSPLAGEMQKDIPYDPTDKVYRAVWMAVAGVPSPGLHVITYSLEFTREIFDGTDYFGPGTKNNKMSDRCEIDVK
jgi:hypothetical protein